MSASSPIRSAVDDVMALRLNQSADAAHGAAVRAVKAFQARRFAGTYADLLADASFGPAARFFVTDLYADKDFAERDQQFARIAAPLERLFPAHVVATAEALASLHSLSERLDDRMGMAWRAAATAGLDEVNCYLSAWRTVGERPAREKQLASVLALGRELTELTTIPGLGRLLRGMRVPARLAGLASLQRFLEDGFDTFAQLSRPVGNAQQFLAVIEQRERDWIASLFDAPPSALLPRLRATVACPA